MSEPIDTGNAPEIFCDDLGSIKIQEHTVEFNAIRIRGEGERVINLTVIVPRAAIPSICKQIATAFAGKMTYSIMERLRSVASQGMN